MGPQVHPYTLRRAIGPLLIAATVLTAAAWHFKGRLAAPTEMDPLLRRQPLQAQTRRPPFSFRYKDKLCRVRPKAAYELWGLVVSHNNIHSVADIYHDSTSVDTKDLCVIWGTNLEHSDYRRVRYKSGPWTCYFSYGPEVRFAHDAIGNNHLITADETIRDRLEAVRIGDQIRLKGLLVDYQMEDWQSFWRQTSTRRDDSDCEVVFVEELEVLRRGTPGWYAAYRAGWTLIVTLPIVYVGLLWVEAGSPETSRIGRL